MELNSKNIDALEKSKTPRQRIDDFLRKLVEPAAARLGLVTPEQRRAAQDLAQQVAAKKQPDEEQKS